MPAKKKAKLKKENLNKTDVTIENPVIDLNLITLDEKYDIESTKIVTYFETQKKTKINGYVIDTKITAECNGIASVIQVFKDNNIECNWLEFDKDELSIKVYDLLKEKEIFNSKTLVKDPFLTEFKNMFRNIHTSFFDALKTRNFVATINNKDYRFKKSEIFGNNKIFWVWNDKKKTYFAYKIGIDLKRLKHNEIFKNSKSKDDLDLMTAMKLKKIFPAVLESIPEDDLVKDSK